MLMMLLRATLLFLTAVLAMRLMGKRQVGQLQPYELVTAIMIAELAAAPMEDVGVPLLYGIVPVLTLMILHSALSIVSVKSQKMREILNGKPSVLVKNGVIDKKELLLSSYNLSDLMEEMRQGGVLNPAELGTAILETSGKVSIFPKAEHRPASTKELNLSVGYEGVPLTIVQDGRRITENLVKAGLDAQWLDRTLEAFGFSGPEEVLLASLDTGGMLFVQGKEEKPRIKLAKALAPENVRW